LKGSGGLTHGGGMSEQQTAVWTMSSVISAEYNIAELSYATSEQHKDMTEARMKGTMMILRR